MFSNKLLENTFWAIIVTLALFFSYKLGQYVELKNSSNEIIQLNYLNGGDKINNGLLTK